MPIGTAKLLGEGEFIPAMEYRGAVTATSSTASASSLEAVDTNIAAQVGDLIVAMAWAGSGNYVLTHSTSTAMRVAGGWQGGGLTVQPGDSRWHVGVVSTAGYFGLRLAPDFGPEHLVIVAGLFRGETVDVGTRQHATSVGGGSATAPTLTPTMQHVMFLMAHGYGDPRNQAPAPVKYRFVAEAAAGQVSSSTNGGHLSLAFYEETGDGSLAAPGAKVDVSPTGTVYPAVTWYSSGSVGSSSASHVAIKVL